MIRLLLCLFVLAVPGVGAFPERAPQPPTVDAGDISQVTLTIDVRNETPEAPARQVPLAVTVKQFSGHGEEGAPVELEAMAPADGPATLTFNPADGAHLVVQCTFKGVPYEVHAGWDETVGTAMAVTLPIYEPTRDGSAISILQHHVLAYSAEGDRLIVYEIAVIQNAESRVWIGEDIGTEHGATMAFSLPKGYANLQFSDGGMSCCGEQTEDRFVSDMPVHPGKTKFEFTYTVPKPTAGAPLDLSRQVFYPTGKLLFLVSSPEIAPTGPGLVWNRETTPKGDVLQTGLAEDLAPGAALPIKLSLLGAGGLPELAAGKPWWKSTWPWSIAVAFGLLALSTAGLWRKPEPAAVPSAATPGEATNDLRAFLANQLADLDSAYQANQVSRQYYEKLRPQLKLHLDRLVS